MTGQLVFCGKELPFKPGESVLDCLLRHEQPVASSCRSGVCHSCIVQGRGSVPPSSQRGLKPSVAAQGYFLACQCPAEQGLEITSAESLPTHQSRVLSVAHLSPGVVRILVERPVELEFRAGQFLSVIRPSDGLTRSYSVASLPNESSIEFHVAVLPGGRMGTYLTETPSAELLLRGPAGDCFYLEDKPEEPLLLAGTGTGLAPLVGVTRAAIAAGHRGPVHLFHGAKEANALYLSHELRALSRAHGTLSYHENALVPPLENGVPDGSRGTGAAQDLFAQVKTLLPSLQGFRVYLCGHPDFVQKMKKQCFLSGAAMQSIHSDPFVLASTSAPTFGAVSKHSQDVVRSASKRH